MMVDGARRFTGLLTAVTVIAAVWAVMPVQHRIAIAILAILPWIGLETVRRSGGVIQIDRRKRSDATPNVAIAVIVPGLVLLVRATTDYNVVQSATVALLSVSAAALLSIGAFMVDPTTRSRMPTVFALALLSLAYGYGVTIEANARFDRSDAESYRVRVEGKHIVRGKSTTYNLDLGPWGPRTEANTLRVSRATYNAVQSGYVAELALRPGAFGIRWYVLRKITRI
jgi:hypothetical protein